MLGITLSDIIMKNKLFLSTLLAACITCVAQAAEQPDVYHVASGNKTVNGDLTTNHFRIEAGSNSTVKVSGTTTIESNIQEGNYYACYMGMNTRLESGSVVFKSSTNHYPKAFTVLGTIQTDTFKAEAADGYSAEINFTSGGKLESTSSEKGTFEVGKNVVVNVGNPSKSAAGYIKNMNTVIDGGTLNVNYYAEMDGISLKNGGSAIINNVPDGKFGPVDSPINLGDINVENGSLYLHEAAISSDITMESGTLQFLGECQTGAVTLNGGSIYFGDNTTPLAMDALALNDEVATVTTGALTLNSGAIYIADNYIIDLGGEDLIIRDNVAVTMSVNSLDDIDGVTLFKTTGNVEGLDNLSVTFVDATGAEKEMGVSYNSDGSVVTSSIPEPTTATLSLLALAGLAARRRRR